MRKFMASVIAVAVLAAPGALGRRIENRKDRQDARVEAAKKSGELNKKEASPKP